LQRYEIATRDQDQRGGEMKFDSNVRALVAGFIRDALTGGLES